MKPNSILEEREISRPISEPSGPTMIDLFCGAGGLSLGFHRVGFVSKWANDIDESAIRTYARNFTSAITSSDDLTSIIEKNPDVIPQVDLVIGGPPCQGFSLLNRNKELDPRRQLWRPFLEAVRLSQASAFVIENVPEIVRSQEFIQIKEAAEALGFSVVAGVLMAADYGVPQIRRRAFIVGARTDESVVRSCFPPTPTHRSDRNGKAKGAVLPCFDLPHWVGVRKAFEGLGEPVGTEMNLEDPSPGNLHFGRRPTELSLERYRAIPEEGMNREDLLRLRPDITPRCWVDKKGGTDLFGRLWWDRPAFTIRTEFYKPEKGRYLHPQSHRPITHREAARLQSFPDDFTFVGSKVAIARQIGNAVPPLLAEAVAKSVKELMVSMGVR